MYIAIAGNIGSGKTTLIKLLCGLLQRMKFVEQHKSRAGNAKQFLEERISKVVTGLENRNYHTGKNK